jgi:transcription elongation factor GreA
LSKLDYLIKNGQVKIGSKESNIADFGKTVTVSNQDSILSFMIVSKYESNPAEKKISADSPLGKALIGKTIGSEVVVNSPKGFIKYTITDIS